MPFCPACHSEFRPGFHHCEECDVDLVDELPEEEALPPASDPSLRSVYQTTELVDAESIRLLLDGNGIEATIHDQYSGMTVFGLPTSVAPLTVTVPAQDAAAAEMIIRKAPRPVSTTSFRSTWLWLGVLLVGSFALTFLLKLFYLLGTL